MIIIIYTSAFPNREAEQYIPAASEYSEITAVLENMEHPGCGGPLPSTGIDNLCYSTTNPYK